MTEKHFMCIHTFVSEAARREYLTPPEFRTPPEERASERQWAEAASGEFATCLQTWLGNSEFFFCHWVAESEDMVIKQLEAFELEGRLINTMVHETQQFMSAYRNSDVIKRQYPSDGYMW